MVRAAIQWNWNRAKIQWNFLVGRERRTIKIFTSLGLILLICAPLLAFFSSSSHPSAVAGFALMMLLSGVGLLATSWATFVDHISPKLLTEEELTQGTE